MNKTQLEQILLALITAEVEIEYARPKIYNFVQTLARLEIAKMTVNEFLVKEYRKDFLKECGHLIS